MNLCEKVAFIALKDTKGPEIWLEANTERSESNRDEVSGLQEIEGRLSGRQYPTDMLLHLRLSPHALKKFTDNADTTDF